MQNLIRKCTQVAFLVLGMALALLLTVSGLGIFYLRSILILSSKLIAFEIPQSLNSKFLTLDKSFTDQQGFELTLIGRTRGKTVSSMTSLSFASPIRNIVRWLTQDLLGFHVSSVKFYLWRQPFTFQCTMQLY